MFKDLYPFMRRLAIPDKYTSTWAWLGEFGCPRRSGPPQPAPVLPPPTCLQRAGGPAKPSEPLVWQSRGKALFAAFDVNMPAGRKVAGQCPVEALADRNWERDMG